MRRLTVVQLLPALSSGGVERSTLEIGAALVAAGHRSLVVSAGGRLVAPLEAAGSEHVTLDIGRKSPGSLRHVASLRRLFAAQGADIVHARSRLPAWLAWHALSAKHSPRPRFVTTVHGMNSPGRYSGIMTRGERVICVSESVRAYVLQNWPKTAPERLRVIERGIDPAQYPRQPWPPARPGGQRLLLMPGRGTRLKGHASAIELLAAVRATGIDAALRLPGAVEEGREHYLEELRAQARALGVEAQLRLEPPIDDMAGAYRDCDLVLQLSDKPESFGRTVIEALCSGRPVVGWDHGGVGESLRRHFPSGLVPLRDSAALLAAALDALAGPQPAPIQAQTLQQMQAQTLELYGSLAS